MVEAGDGPLLVRAVRPGLEVLHRLEVVLHEERRVGVEEGELSSPPRDHYGVAVRGRVEGAQTPPLAVRERDVAVAPSVEAGEARRCPLVDLDADERRARVLAQEPRCLEHGRAAEARGLPPPIRQRVLRERRRLHDEGDGIVGREGVQERAHDRGRRLALVPTGNRVEDDAAPAGARAAPLRRPAPGRTRRGARPRRERSLRCRRTRRGSTPWARSPGRPDRGAAASVREVGRSPRRCARRAARGGTPRARSGGARP